MNKNTVSNWDKFFKNSSENRVFLRASKKLKLTKNQKNVVKKQKIRNSKALDIIFKVQQELEKRNLKVVAIKTYDNYPDFGGDVDFLAEVKNYKYIDNVMKKVFKAKKPPESISGRLSRKAQYLVEGSPIGIEFHFGGFCQVGEKTIPASQIIKNREKIRIEGKTFYTPCLEDALLITVIHRVYRHISIKFCDAYNIKKMVKDENLDWEYIIKTAKEVGIMPGLVYYMKFLEDFGISDFPNISEINKYPYYIKFSGFLKTYLGKLIYDGFNLSLGSLVRMGLIYPMLLTVTFITRKLLKSNFTW